METDFTNIGSPEFIIRCENCRQLFSIPVARSGEKYCPACRDWFNYKAEVESD